MIPFWIFDFRYWNRRTKSTKSLSFGLAVLLFALSLPAEAQQQKKLHRIGLLTTGFPDSLPHLINAFKQGLRDHGYVEGQNVLLELRYAEAEAERLPSSLPNWSISKLMSLSLFPIPRSTLSSKRPRRFQSLCRSDLTLLVWVLSPVWRGQAET
jgi:hypothetical protein